MTDHQTLAAHNGKLIILGFGTVGQGVLPLLLRHVKMDKSKIQIISGDERGRDIAEKYGLSFTCKPVTKENYRQVLSGLSEGDFLLNLSVNVSSVALIELCQEKKALYLDTCIEPWEGYYTDTSLTPAQRSNYQLREDALALKKKYPKGPTAMLAHGVNPGIISHFVKRALLNLAKDINGTAPTPKTREEWAKLAQELGVKVIHVAERDTQKSKTHRSRDEFVNTWSVDGFISEGLQPAELGWGSHEKQLPEKGSQHEQGCLSAIYINRPGASVRVRSWTPDEGPYYGFLITHNEAISIADYFSIRDANGKVIYRPTVHYAYHPCDDAILSLHEFAGKSWKMPERKRVMMDEIDSGVDELGILLMGHKKGGYWWGSKLTYEEARKLAPHNNATSLQVTSSVLGGVIWVLENTQAGIVEAEDADHERVIEVAAPYMGKLSGHYTDWTPLKGREGLFNEKIDQTDPWQFSNFLVH